MSITYSGNWCGLNGGAIALSSRHPDRCQGRTQRAPGSRITHETTIEDRRNH